MNDKAPKTRSKLSMLESVLLGILTALICTGLCGMLGVFLFRTGRLSSALNLVSTPLGNAPEQMTAVTAMPTPTWIPTSPVLEPVPSATRSTDPHTLMVEAKSLMQEGEYEQALPVWDEVIVRLPENADAYYQRALCYYNLLAHEHVFETYEHYIRSALADMDTAIALQPDNGDYYAFRHDVFSELTGTMAYRVDRQAIVRIAHQDAGAAITLGYTEAYRFTDRVYVADLTSLEQCEQSLKEIDRMIHATSPNDSTITGLYRMGAEALACQGRYKEAVVAITNSLLNSANSDSKTYLKALYLYQLGKLDEALAVIDESITGKPTFMGYRYYLRALIYYDQGKPDLAEADLQMGSPYTWERSGLYAYVRGKMALDAGQRAEGIEQLQLAEASLDENCMLIRSRIIKELARVGAEPLSLTPTITIPSTPIPIEQP